MELEKEIKNLEKDLDKYSRFLMETRKELSHLRKCRQPSFSELFNGIDKLITITHEKGKSYRNILGGDGRSRPYDEIKTGDVITININNGIYLTPIMKGFVEDYVKHSFNCDYIKFKRTK